MLINELDILTSERDSLQAKINETALGPQSANKILAEIDEWERKTMAKIKEAADLAKQQATKIMNSKREIIKQKFQNLSSELKERRETKSVAEQDLERLRQQIQQINKNLEEAKQSLEIELNTTQSDQVVWGRIIYIEEKPSSVGNESRGATPINQNQTPPDIMTKNLPCNGHACPQCGKCTDWYPRGSIGSSGSGSSSSGSGGSSGGSSSGSSGSSGGSSSWTRRVGATCTRPIPGYGGYPYPYPGGPPYYYPPPGPYYPRDWVGHLCSCKR